MVEAPAKLARQMLARGRTEADIAEARERGERHAVVNRETGTPATRYVHRAPGDPWGSTTKPERRSMSGETASAIDSAVVHVRITNEAVDVWRPVTARQLSGAVYELSQTPPPEDEVWAFEPGDRVVVERREQSGEQQAALVAVARASDLDSLSAAYARTPVAA